jgi:DNA-directed RNA polymerase specialized sigma subunit
MLYFYRSTITKVPEHNVDSIELMAEGDNGDQVFEIAHPTDYETSITLGIDFKYSLSEDALIQQDFSNKERTVYDLHFNQGYTVTEVAKEINLSTPQASKIISKIKTKVHRLLSK